MEANRILTGDALQMLKMLPDGCIQMICTSPPYYRLRDYGIAGQIGLEEIPGEYITKLVEVFREARRVLRHDGTFWLNIGDSYAGSGKGGGGSYESDGMCHASGTPDTHIPGIRPKNLMMIPARLAIALQDDGWILRSDIIWHKLNAMPESVEDRPTSAHEHVFLFAKSEHYYYDQDAIREPHKTVSNLRDRGGESQWASEALLSPLGKGVREWNHPSGRNKRNVWTLSSQPYKEAHFATMPPKLVEPCVLAGTSLRACETCGAPWQRQIERIPMIIRNGPKAGGYGSRTTDGLSGTMIAPTETRTIGWEPTCTCTNQGTGRCIVLDPFCGAGTVPLVALQNNRHYIGIELNPNYVELIHKRIAHVQPELWSAVTVA